MLAIDRIFDILRNGNWHRLADVAEKIGTQENKIELISSFLSDYDFLEYDRNAKRIKLSSELQDFFGKIKEAEQEEAAEKGNRPS